jgi:hypothetical protein
VDAHDRRVLESWILFPQETRALAGRHRHDDRVGIELSERLDTLVETDAVGEHTTGRPAVHPTEGLRREHQVTVRARAKKGCPNGEQAGPGVDLVCRKVECRPDEDVPETVDGSVARAEPA